MESESLCLFGPGRETRVKQNNRNFGAQIGPPITSRTSNAALAAALRYTLFPPERHACLLHAGIGTSHAAPTPVLDIMHQQQLRSGC